ncbi:hypothetical protein Zmor_024707 [Zophobas morio]|uniref:Peptidase C1A papain C-terminal domain-containing protein n=1 Tax=Zophobas morio TaxID=2755281 RepID=A0AA38HYX5_9CUCU|nr:hypothetical protein Zmor_024707 [Zophobas morio]
MKLSVLSFALCLVGVLSIPNPKEHRRIFNPDFVADIPDSVDWREKGAVTPIKNQALCGAWVYSVTGVLEGQNFLKNGELVPLSEQELADCATQDGCSGGTVEEGYEYVIAHGLASAEDYPGPSDGTCHRGSIPSTVTESDYVTVEHDEETLRQAVATIGPISVAVNALGWEMYVGGILKCEDSETLNHGALLVGYGSEDGVDYWLLKNSWGEAWGEQGYIRVDRTPGADCGITLAATYPVV